MKPRYIERSILAVLMGLSLSHGFAADGDVGAGCEWYRQDSLARELSQLTEREILKFAESELIEFRPAIVPNAENVVGANDYFMWPIATKVGGTLVVPYARSLCHWGKEAIFQVSRSLDTPAVRDYLSRFYKDNSSAP